MADEKRSGKMSPGLKATLIGGTAACLIVGGLWAENKYDIIDRIQGKAYEAKTVAIDMMNTDPYEATDNLIEVLEENKDLVEQGEYDIGKIVGRINDLRGKDEVMEDSVAYLAQSEQGRFEVAVDDLMGQLSEEKAVYVADSSFGTLDQRTRFTFLEEKSNILSENDKVDLTLSVVENDEDVYKKTVDGMLNGDSQGRFLGEVCYQAVSDNNLYDGLANSLVQVSSPEQLNVLTDKSIGMMDPKGKVTYISEKMKEVPEDSMATLAFNLSENFSREDYETVIPGFFMESEEKYNNEYGIFKDLLSIKMGDVKDYYKKGIESTKDLYQKGREYLTNQPNE